MKSELKLLFPVILKMLENGKIVQLEYNKKNEEFKLLECKVKRIKKGDV